MRLLLSSLRFRFFSTRSFLAAFCAAPTTGSLVGANDLYSSLMAQGGGEAREGTQSWARMRVRRRHKGEGASKEETASGGGELGRQRIQLCVRDSQLPN